ncbi:hypothetical protein AAVH_11087 [Aphelenchoides avenae]|nr:hypothetical protein AAVH_11087 [Aphelenchus avenae]
MLPGIANTEAEGLRVDRFDVFPVVEAPARSMEYFSESYQAKLKFAITIRAKKGQAYYVCMNKALGKDFDKDSQFCVGKRNQVFAEGIYTGGPIIVRDDPSRRYLQVGIAIKADAENNYGSATRVTLYQNEIINLTGCYLTGGGLDSKTSGKNEC